MKKKPPSINTENCLPVDPESGSRAAHTKKTSHSDTFSHIIKFAPFPIVVIDDKDRVEYVNPGFTDLFGYTRNELSTLTDWFNTAYPDPEYRARVLSEWNADQDTIVKKTPRTKSFYVTCKNGLMKHITFHVTYTKKKIIIFFEDTTEQDNAETELKTINRRYKSIIENINDALFIHDFNGTILDVNDNTLKLTGYTLEELLGKNLQDLGRAPVVNDKIKNLLIRDSILFEGILTKKDGTPVPVSVSSRVVARDGKGIVQAFARDLSELKKSAELLQQSEENTGLYSNGPPWEYFISTKTE